MRNWRDNKRPKPYDLNEIGRQRLHQRFRNGYRPGRGSPYDLNHVWIVREYHEGKWRR